VAFQTGGRNCGLDYLGSADEDWSLLETLAPGTGVRFWGTDISFPTEFSEIPTLVINIRSFASPEGDPARVSVGYLNLLATGFTLRISTWGDSSVIGIGVNWSAYDSASAL